MKTTNQHIPKDKKNPTVSPQMRRHPEDILNPSPLELCCDTLIQMHLNVKFAKIDK